MKVQQIMLELKMLRTSLYSAIQVMFLNLNKILPKNILFYFQEPGTSFQSPYRDVPVPREVLTKNILNLDRPGDWAPGSYYLLLHLMLSKEVVD